MNLSSKWASDLMGKDRNKSQKAAEHLLNDSDIEAWKCIIENSEYFFSYVKDKAGQNLINAVNKANLYNVFNLLKIHSQDWDSYIAEMLEKFTNEDIETKIIETLKTGSDQEKAYCAKYFTISPKENVKDLLFENLNSSYEPLKNNCAQALGLLNDAKAYEYFINKLNNGDDWDKIESARLLSLFSNKDAIKPMLNAMSKSGMAEHIAGEIASLSNIYELFESNDAEIKEMSLEAFDNILSGISEIWSLSVLFDFKIYDSLEKLIELAKLDNEESLKGKYAQLLLKAKGKIALISGNTEYTFDEEKNILAELDEINHLLLCEESLFWEKQVQELSKEINSNNEKRITAAIQIISEFELKEFNQELINLVLNSNNSEIIVCEALSAICKLGYMSKIENKDAILSRITDNNLHAVAESLF